MSAEDNACLPDLLASLARQLKGITVAHCDKPGRRAADQRKSRLSKQGTRTAKTAGNVADPQPIGGKIVVAGKKLQ
jgi:hypothetical protein